MANDREYSRRRAAEAGSGPFHREDCEGAEVAGHLALAYAALARRRGSPAADSAADTADAVVAPTGDLVPLMLQD
ncbi:MAG: hypothetical protein ABIT68_10070 [Sphingomicrobium sp.]